MFERCRERLARNLGHVALRIDHFGSTSVRGLAGKPIIDIQLGVADVLDELAYVPGCVASGFELYSRDDAHRIFHVPPPSLRVAQLHECQTSRKGKHDHLLHRDCLRAHDDERDAYARMKQEAARKWKDDRTGYTYVKSGLILDRRDKAKDLARSTGWDVASS